MKPRAGSSELLLQNDVVGFDVVKTQLIGAPLRSLMYRPSIERFSSVENAIPGNSGCKKRKNDGIVVAYM